MKKKEQPKESEVCFEEALGKLEITVKQLEAGDLPLEESLACFAEGMNLSKLCLAKLDQAEKTLDKILESREGKIVEQQLSLLEEE